MYTKSINVNNPMANDRIVKFIQLYRSCECLWNVSSKDYGSKLSRNAAFDTISRKMQIPNLGPREVARKIKNLKSAYQLEVKKIKEKSLSGIVYRPSAMWFNLLDEFLQNSEKSVEHNCRSNDHQSTDRSETTQQTVSNINDENNVSSITKNLFKFESSSDNESNSSSRRNKTSLVDVIFNERQKKRRRKEKDRMTLNEYKSFGKYVAKNLNKMPFEYAISAETEIHSIIIKYKVYAMRKIVYSKRNTTSMIKRHPSTFLPSQNFSSILRHSIHEIRPT
ncbi:PREDICTED: uncharacterized protein LOC107066600 [Polistes dominula]|uniref:Uncharacterized protein LOC107066600 n=1 Tax=Polistes dominula TaxID=743375 RepID=A0ABM1I9I6_POLDO|nr:PREDICTED: uncharacterized protein LOC107066600 [Polistes dominula]XP_015176874.1 PREDICTED: uncharacterized protein LOC107066600 [Polistes dominula]